jgi:hypothetical protein
VNERRHFSRVAFDADAVLTTTEDRLAVKVIDLSLKGALLRQCAALPVSAGAPCLVEVKLGDLRIAMAAEIAHVHGDQIGVLCRSIDIESITHLRRLIEMNLGDARLLERELKALISGA